MSKLIRVMPGLYRTPNGAITVARHPWKISGYDGDRDNPKQRPWTIRWTTFLGAKRVQRVRTLAEARDRVCAVSE